MAKKIMFPVGHGGGDTGAIDGGLIEKNINLIVALAAEMYLKPYEVDVKLSRYTDKYLSSDDRIKLVGDYNPNLSIDVHHNWCTTEKVRGAEVIHAHYDTEDDVLAQIILMKMAQIGMPTRRSFTKLNDRKEDWYYGIREMWDNDTDAIIFEGGFISNAKDRALLSTHEFLMLEGKVLAESCVEYLGLELKPEFKHWCEPIWQQLNNNGININEKRFDEDIKRGETFAVANQLKLDYMKRMDDLATDLIAKISDIEKRI